MTLTESLLGTYIELIEENNKDSLYSVEFVRGVNNEKKFMPTKADLAGRDLTKFQIVRPGTFVFNHRTSRNGSKFSIALNETSSTFICTEDYVLFRIKEKFENKLLPEYIYMFFCRPEFDRYVITNSWGSSTEFYNWEDICNVKLIIPSIDIQHKYVNIYKAMVSNLKAYQTGLDDLKLVCNAYIENLRTKYSCEKIGRYLRYVSEKNENNKIRLFQGINVDHIFTDPKRIAEDSENGSIVRTGQFAFNKVMKAHNTKLPIALREGPDCVVSNSYEVFEIVDVSKLLPKYLLLWFNREETQRYAGYISFGTTRDIFTFEDLSEIEIPIPPLEIQQAIVDIYVSYQERVSIVEKKILFCTVDMEISE